LAHELAHVWLGNSAIFNLNATYPSAGEIEVFCNKVAAEVLVPMELFTSEWNQHGNTEEQIYGIARKWKVSRLVIARRAHDAGFVTGSYFKAYYNRESRSGKPPTGGDYYAYKPYEAGRKFSAAIIKDARNGRTTFKDAMRLLGIRRTQAFERYADTIGAG